MEASQPEVEFMESINNFARKILENSFLLDGEFVDFVNNNFWDLLWRPENDEDVDVDNIDLKHCGDETT